MRARENVHPLPCVTCLVSCIMWYMSRVRNYLSGVYCHFLGTQIRLVRGGSVTNMACPFFCLFLFSVKTCSQLAKTHLIFDNQKHTYFWTTKDRNLFISSIKHNLWVHSDPTSVSYFWEALNLRYHLCCFWRLHQPWKSSWHALVGPKCGVLLSCSILCRLPSSYCILHSVHCPLHTEQCTAHWKLHNLHSRTAHWTLHTALCNFSLHTVHCTLFTGPPSVSSMIGVSRAVTK